METGNINGYRISRAQFLRAMLAVSLYSVTPAFAQSKPIMKLSTPLVPVNVDPSRVIRTVVGLRPYRPSGFVVKAESFGHKTLVHNYGHGGCGVSLSWGCARLAADLVNGKSPSQAAVIGCGVMGLTTARMLQDRGWQVQIYTEKVQPDTTSNIAGALWSPTMLFDDDQITAQFKEQFQKATRDSYRAFQLLVGANYGVHWLDVYTLTRPTDKDDEDKIEHAKRLGYGDLYPAVADIDPASTPFAPEFSKIRRFSEMLIEPNTYLPALMHDFLLRGGKIAVRKFDDQSEWHKLHEKVIFNCTGLGARKLVNDEQLEPIRGQLTFLEPQPEVNYVAFADDLYMFPRSDGILLGGTYGWGNWSLDPDPEAEARILRGHAAIYK
jgi:glycine/D-amino acid oxidase-like deaminating enzyme